MLLVVTASLLVGLVVTISDPTPLPKVATGVKPQCPPAGALDYYFPTALMDHLPVQNDFEGVRYLTGLLGEGRPVWCGSVWDEVYRFVIVGYPKEFVVTIGRERTGWTVNAHQRWLDGREPAEWVEQKLSGTELTRIARAIDDVGFWQMPLFEPPSRDELWAYHGFTYIIEARVIWQADAAPRLGMSPASYLQREVLLATQLLEITSNSTTRKNDGRKKTKR